jgi:hypothetical protein
MSQNQPARAKMLTLPWPDLMNRYPDLTGDAANHAKDIGYRRPAQAILRLLAERMGHR